MKKTVLFTECEHSGDMNDYIDDLEISGATIISSEMALDAEECKIVIEIENIENFKTAFRVTDGYDFATII